MNKRFQHFIILILLYACGSSSNPLMKYLIIILLFSCAVKQSTTSNNNCRNFESDLEKYYRKASNSQQYASCTDNLIQSFKTKNNDCLVGKDSTYIIEKLGRKYNMMGGRIPLKYRLEYVISTPNFPMLDPKPGLTVLFGLDSLNIVRTITIGTVQSGGYE